MIETSGFKNVVIFIQTILSSVLSAKIIYYLKKHLGDIYRLLQRQILQSLLIYGASVFYVKVNCHLNCI